MKRFALVSGILGGVIIGGALNSALASQYEDGHADRQRWEEFFSAQTGTRRDGALFWSGQRSLNSPKSCGGDNGYASRDFYAGCMDAREMLAPFDRRRRADAGYRAGWNAEVTKLPIVVPEASGAHARAFAIPSTQDQNDPSIAQPAQTKQSAASQSTASNPEPEQTVVPEHGWSPGFGTFIGIALLVVFFRWVFGLSSSATNPQRVTIEIKNAPREYSSQSSSAAKPRSDDEVILRSGMETKLFLRYRDGKDAVTDRIVQVNQVRGTQKDGAITRIHTWCFTAKGKRTFLRDRIIAVGDEKTGEIIDDLDVFLLGRPANPRYVPTIRPVLRSMVVQAVRPNASTAEPKRRSDGLKDPLAGHELPNFRVE